MHQPILGDAELQILRAIATNPNSNRVQLYRIVTGNPDRVDAAKVPVAFRLSAQLLHHAKVAQRAVPGWEISPKGSIMLALLDSDPQQWTVFELTSQTGSQTGAISSITHCGSLITIRVTWTHLDDQPCDLGKAKYHYDLAGLRYMAIKNGVIIFISGDFVISLHGCDAQ